ncbi:MAG: hypothetical protein QOE65_841 [Solirubrobacteraceae bacterium]|jgi:hypothetical protein|nr:hypothetical protein [Solirubrobacteraceae bacterium]
MPGEHRRARRAAGAAITILLALAGGIGLLLFFVSRDEAPVKHNGTTTPLKGPGQPLAGDPARELPSQGRARLVRALRVGDVVLVYGRREDEAPLTALARDVAGAPDSTLEDAGQAVLVARRRTTPGVVALASQRVLRTGSATDPELRRFADAWLGRGAGG